MFTDLKHWLCSIKYCLNSLLENVTECDLRGPSKKVLMPVDFSNHNQFTGLEPTNI